MDFERRRSPRYPLDLPVGIRFPRGPVKEGWGRIIDISGDGLQFMTRFPVKATGVVYVNFTLHEGGHFENLRARVMRVRVNDGYYFAGIAFDEVVDQQTLREVVTALVNEGRLKMV
jgi:hypothetical protein